MLRTKCDLVAVILSTESTYSYVSRIVLEDTLRTQGITVLNMVTDCYEPKLRAGLTVTTHHRYGSVEARYAYWQELHRVTQDEPATVLVLQWGHDISHPEVIRDAVEFHPEAAIVAPHYRMWSKDQYRADGPYRPRIAPIAAPYSSAGQFSGDRLFPDYVYGMPQYLAPLSVLDYREAGKTVEGTPVLRDLPA